MAETDILIYIGWIAKKVTRYSLATNVMLVWLALVIFNSAVLIFPISIGRALLLAITRLLPIACGLKSNGKDYSAIVIAQLTCFAKKACI